MFIRGTKWSRESKRQLPLVMAQLLPRVLLSNGQMVPVVSGRSRIRPPLLPGASTSPRLPPFSSQKWVAITSSISQTRRLRQSWDLSPGLLIAIQGSFHAPVSTWLRLHEDIYWTSSMCQVLSSRGTRAAVTQVVLLVFC